MSLAMTRKPTRVQRPPAVTWLAGLVFLLGMANLSIVVTGLTRRSVLGMLPLTLSLPVLMVLGGLGPSSGSEQHGGCSASNGGHTG